MRRAGAAHSAGDRRDSRRAMLICQLRPEADARFRTASSSSSCGPRTSRRWSSARKLRPSAASRCRRCCRPSRRRPPSTERKAETRPRSRQQGRRAASGPRSISSSRCPAASKDNPEFTRLLDGERRERTTSPSQVDPTLSVFAIGMTRHGRPVRVLLALAAPAAEPDDGRRLSLRLRQEPGQALRSLAAGGHVQGRGRHRRRSKPT